ncbi:MAG TPA: hypothetical protein VK608_14840, partial [Edaphobacter sp.]|nr:hypothetical protein [Edaphobacter sp.]
MIQNKQFELKIPSMPAIASNHLYTRINLQYPASYATRLQTATSSITQFSLLFKPILLSPPSGGDRRALALRIAHLQDFSPGRLHLWVALALTLAV